MRMRLITSSLIQKKKLQTDELEHFFFIRHTNYEGQKTIRNEEYMRRHLEVEESTSSHGRQVLGRSQAEQIREEETGQLEHVQLLHMHTKNMPVSDSP